MNTPNPLVPQGSLQQQQSRGNSTVRIAVFTIIAIHAVFFSGLLIQGCRPDAEKSTANKISGLTNLTSELPKPDTNYYSSLREPGMTTNIPATNEFAQQPATPPSTPAVLQPAPVVEKSPETKEYTIVKGDLLYKIAKAHNVTVAAITNANPGINPSKLQVGQKIQIPAAKASTPHSAAGVGFAEPGPSEGATNIHVVKAGENLTSIARQHGTTAQAIRTANNLKSNRILAGQKLKLPAPQKPGVSAATGSTASGRPVSLSSTNAVSSLPLGSSGSNPR